MGRTELRKYPRIKVNFPVECSLAGETYRARALTLGGGGLLLGMSEQVAPSTELTVRFRPARHLAIFQARAKTLYQLRDQGIGIEFTDISPEDRQIILRLIVRRIGDMRRYPRRRFVAQVECEPGTFLGISRDLSVGGMFIETKELLSEGSGLKIRFHLDDGGPVVVATAEVRYAVEKLGVGVQFFDLPPTDRSRIDAFVAKGESSA